MPPPSPSFEILSLPTITLMITITFVMQATAIAFNSRTVNEYKGIWTGFLATISLALGFAIILLRRMDVITGLLSNGLILAGHVLIYVAICQFINKPLNRYLIYGLVPAGYVGLIILALLPPGGIPLITLTQLVGFPLNIAAAHTLYRADTSRYKLGAYLTSLPLMVYGAVTVIRFLTGVFNPREVLPGPSTSNIFDIMSLYVLSYLWIAGFILMISQRLQSDLHDLTMNDALTRIRNRRAMQSLLDFEMRRVQTEVKDFSVTLLDVDHFKLINDTHGHDVGDIVLQWMAQTLQSALRVQDIVARWGGEEFLILLPDTSLGEAMEIAERLRELVEESIVGGTPILLNVSFSAGVSNSRTNRNVNELCKVADQALNIAKQKRNRIASQDEISTSIKVAIAQ
jgi:diguanylate cyclase (GGDEF)-like protein